MNSPVRTIRVDDHLYEAIGYMRRHRRPHLPVVDGRGDLVGMLELHAALEVAAGPLVDDIDRLTHEDSLVGLAEVKTAQVQLADLRGSTILPGASKLDHRRNLWSETTAWRLGFSSRAGRAAGCR